MARQSPVSKDAGFLHVIIERDSLAHGNAQGFVFKRSEELCPEGKPPYGAPKPRVERRGVFARHNRKRSARAWECAGIRVRAKRRTLPYGQASLWRAKAPFLRDMPRRSSGSHDGENYHSRQQSDRDGYQKHEDIGYGKSFFMVMGSVLRSNYKR